MKESLEDNKSIASAVNKRITTSMRFFVLSAISISVILIFLTFLKIILCYAFANPLVKAIEWGNARAVEKLLMDGYDANKKIGSKTLLTYTILNSIHTPKSFIRHKNQTELNEKIDANVQKMIGILEVFINNGANINELDDDGQAIIHYAISKFIYMEARTKVVQWLLEKGADPNLKNLQGHTPLQIAIKNNNHEIEDLLRRSGAKE